MKRILFAALLTVGIAFSALNVSAGEDNGEMRWQRNRDGMPNAGITRNPGNRYHQRPSSEPRIGAQEMSVAGLLAASAMGTGIYAVRRRAKSRT